jgi:hypothetical protein
MQKINIQLVAAVLLTVAGLTMLFMGLWIAPKGEIHHSVLVAFGEASTFAGALFGVDYSYKFKSKNRRKNEENDIANSD